MIEQRTATIIAHTRRWFILTLTVLAMSYGLAWAGYPGALWLWRDIMGFSF